MKALHAPALRIVRRIAPALALATAGCGGGSSHHGGPAAPTVTAVSSTEPPASATDVATNRKITVTFDRDMDASTIDTSSFQVATSIGGVPVLGTVNYDAADRTATFAPVGALAINTNFTATLTTDVADFTAAHLAVPYVWSFLTGAAADVSPPGVLGSIPADGSSGSDLNHMVVVSFDEPIDAGSVSVSTFTLAAPGPTLVTGTVGTAGSSIVFQPDADLSPGVVYTATVAAAVSDLAGNALGTDHVFTFTTGATSDLAAPTVLATAPANAATAIAVNGKICATFSEPVDPRTLTTAAITLTGPGGAEGGTVSIGSSSELLCFTPLSDLAGDATFTAVVTTAVKDLAGHALAAPIPFTFTTRLTRDDTTPRVVTKSPDDGATNVAVNQKIVVNFSEAIDPATVNSATFSLASLTTNVTGTIATSGATATFTPDAQLPAATSFTAMLTIGVKDLAGNALPAPEVWAFSTGATSDTTPPAVASTNPVDLATAIAIDQAVNATFDEAIDPATLDAASFTVVAPGPIAVTGAVSLDVTNTIATFVPDATLPANTQLTATLTTAVTDLAGNPLAADFVFTFTTDAHTGVATVDLASAATFGVMATDSTVEVGTSTVNGDVAVGSGTGQGFAPGDVNGTIHVADEVVLHAQADLSVAYADAVSRILGAKPLAADLSGLTLTAGLHKNSSDVTISSGAVTLDAQGDPNAVFLLQVGGALSTGASTQVLLVNGANAANVFWQVGGDATLGASSTFAGSVLAAQSITVNAGSSADGRLLAGALGAAATVTLDSSVVTVPVH
ncbi:MAG TPA: Ig-like domain-containing protein [Planctomycetota bacterium]|jgi:methionine-rich copper-binding protein CopC|nr:Ig-like domain-containing protein [Planctomycetota bacterium]